MNKNYPIFAAIIVVIAALAYFLPDLVQQDEKKFFSINYRDPKAVAAGKVLYNANCASCHGVSLQGESPNWRQQNADGSLPAPPHDETGHTWHHPDIMLFQSVKYGGQSDPASGFVSRMPAYEGRLSDQEIHDILAYIKKQWPLEIQQRHNAMNKKFEEANQ